MCGRVTLALDKQMILDILADAFEVTNAPAISNVPNYNMGPSSKVLTLIQPGAKDKRRAGQLTWGFVPPWTKESEIKYSLINARSETVLENLLLKLPFPISAVLLWQTPFMNGNGKK